MHNVTAAKFITFLQTFSLSISNIFQTLFTVHSSWFQVSGCLHKINIPLKVQSSTF